MEGRTRRLAVLVVTAVLSWTVTGGCRGRPQGGEAVAVGNVRPVRTSTPLTRALWVWHAGVISNDAKKEQFLVFCRQKRIGLVFVDVGGLFAEGGAASGKPQVTADQLAGFASAVHEAGMKLHALDGDAPWARAMNHQVPIGRLGKAIAFNGGQQTDYEKLDGFQFDIEPHTLKDVDVGSDEWREVMGECLELTGKLSELVSDTAPKFELGFAIPFWWDEENTDASELTWKGSTKPVAHHLIDILASVEAPYVAIMAYRDTAGGPDGSIAHSEHELTYADQKAGHVRVYVGQETGDVAGEPQKITFWQEGEEALNEAVTQIEAALRSHRSFAGVAIHHYDSYRELAARPEEPAEPDQPFSITTPSEGDRVGRFTTVYGTAPTEYVGRKVNVSVLPEGDIWYEQGSGGVDKRGKWQVDCHIGGAMTPAGMKFTVKAEVDGEVVQIHVVKE